MNIDRLFNIVKAFLLILALFYFSISQVYAAQTKPPTTTSWYVNYVSGDTDQILYNWMYSRGYEAGQNDLNLSGTQNSVAVLHFGQPAVQSSVYGTSGYGRFLSTTVIKEAARQFAYGYYIGTGSDTLSQMRMVIGTSNNGSNVTYSHGQAWAQLIKDIGSAISSYASQVTVRGGSDLEVNWSTPTTAINWVNGYASSWVSPYYLYNFGDAGGCPQSGTTGTPGSCNNGWTQDNVEYISWGNPSSYPLPQIYSTAGGNAKQWQQIALYSYLRYSRDMFITAPLSQSQACIQRGGCTGTNNTPQQAWDQLWTELNNDTRTAQNLWWSTDIKWRQ